MLLLFKVVSFPSCPHTSPQCRVTCASHHLQPSSSNSIRQQTCPVLSPFLIEKRSPQSYILRPAPAMDKEKRVSRLFGSRILSIFSAEHDRKDHSPMPRMALMPKLGAQESISSGAATLGTSKSPLPRPRLSLDPNANNNNLAAKTPLSRVPLYNKRLQPQLGEHYSLLQERLPELPLENREMRQNRQNQNRLDPEAVTAQRTRSPEHLPALPVYLSTHLRLLHRRPPPSDSSSDKLGENQKTQKESTHALDDIIGRLEHEIGLRPYPKDGVETFLQDGLGEELELTSPNDFGPLAAQSWSERQQGEWPMSTESSFASAYETGPENRGESGSIEDSEKVDDRERTDSRSVHEREEREGGPEMWRRMLTNLIPSHMESSLSHFSLGQANLSQMSLGQVSLTQVDLSPQIDDVNVSSMEISQVPSHVEIALVPSHVEIALIPSHIDNLPLNQPLDLPMEGENFKNQENLTIPQSPVGLSAEPSIALSPSLAPITKSPLDFSFGYTFPEPENVAGKRPELLHKRVLSVSSTSSALSGGHVNLATLKRAFSLRPGEGERCSYVQTIRRNAGTAYNETGPGKWKLPTGIMPLDRKTMAISGRFTRLGNTMSPRMKKTSGVELKHGHLQPRLLAAEVDEVADTNRFGSLGRSSTQNNRRAQLTASIPGRVTPTTSILSTPPMAVAGTPPGEASRTASVSDIQSVQTRETTASSDSEGSVAEPSDGFYQHPGYNYSEAETDAFSIHEDASDEEKPHLFLANPDSSDEE